MAQTSLFNQRQALPATKRLPWGMLVAIFIGLIAAAPMIRGLPESAGHLLHLYRTVHLDDLVQNGIFYSRWLPDLGFGYGYPLFNYYAPFSYYLVELLHFLGFSLVGAYLAAYALAFTGASLFTYLWVRSLFDEPAALVAAALYAFSPYLLEDGLHQGALAEIVALSLMPLILFCFHQVITTRRWVYGLSAVLAYAALILSHNITALIFTPVLILYVLIVAYTQTPTVQNRLRLTIRQVLPAFGLILLALALSAFFWLPALAEQDLVQINQVISPIHFNYDVNFLVLKDLLALPFVSDPNLVLQPIPNGLSLIAILLGLVGLASAGLYRDRPLQLAHILFAGLVLLCSAFMTLSISSVFWERIPLLPFLQFPHRFLGLATLFLALLAGVGTISLVNLLKNRRWLALSVPVIVVGLIALYAIPWLFVDYFEPSPSATIEGSAEFERTSGAVGTTSAGEYLPITVLEMPQDLSELAEANERLDRSSLPAEFQILAAEYTPLAYALMVDSPTAFSAVFNTFYFEGWTAAIDGKPAEINPTQPHGLISVNGPPGEHELAIQYKSTTIRTGASVVSWITLLLLVPLMLLLYRGKSGTDSKTSSLLDQGWLFALIALILLVVLAFKIVYLDRSETLIRRSIFDGQTVANVGHQLNANFENQMILLGADVPETVAADGDAMITLYWRVPSQVAREFSVSAILVDGNNLVVGQSDKQHPGVIPTTDWQVDEYAADVHKIRLTPGTPPGIYDVQVNVYEYGRPENRLNLLDNDGAPAGQSLPLGSLSIHRPENPPDLGDLDPEQRVDIPSIDGLTLTGYALPDYAVRPGDPLYLELFWLATAVIGEDIEMLIEMTDAADQVVHTETMPLVAGFPTSLWLPGDLWRALHPVLLPATLDSGDYHIALQVGADERISLGMVQITAPDHIMTEPSFTYPAGTRFGEVAQLVGYDLPIEAAPGDQLPIRLIWQALGETPTSYKVFVQLLDDDGRLLTGSDGLPANWERPTTGWITGEYIVDTHTLSLPAGLPLGSYELLVGLYDSGSGQRLLTAGGNDASLLPQVIEMTAFVPDTQ